jgi:hypothetical protein
VDDYLFCAVLGNLDALPTLVYTRKLLAPQLPIGWALPLPDRSDYTLALGEAQHAVVSTRPAGPDWWQSDAVSKVGS